MIRSVSIAAFVGAMVVATPALAGPDAGETLFKQRCQMCHTRAPDARNGVGPNLWGLSGRKAGTAPNFKYSTSLTKSDIKWSQQTLDQFLTLPNKMVPGTRMVVSIPKEADRKAVVQFLLSKKK